MKVKDKMTKNVAYVNSTTSVTETAQLMQKHNVGSIPVVDNDSLVGIVTDRDIVVRNIAHEKDPNTTPISSVMTTQVVSVTPDADVDDVTAKMSTNQIRRVPVVENNKLVGILAIGDVATDRRFNMEASKALTEISRPAKPEMM